MPKNLCIVYYVYLINDPKCKTILEGQLQDIVQSNILEEKTEFHITLCGSDILREAAKQSINRLVQTPVILHESSLNRYEYPGIKLIYDLALRNPGKYFLYMHTKGMVYHKQYTGRLQMEINITRKTLEYYKKVIQIFNEDTTINKIGLFPNKSGAIWFNFWYVRGSYVKEQLPEPILVEEYTVEPKDRGLSRFHYERWLGLNTNKKNDYYSLVSNSIKWYEPQEASNLVRFL